MNPSAILNPSAIFRFAGRTLFAFLWLVLCYLYQLLACVSVVLSETGVKHLCSGIPWLSNYTLLPVLPVAVVHFYLYSGLWLFVGLTCWGITLPPKDKWPASLVLGIFLILGNLIVLQEVSELPMLFSIFNGLSIISIFTGYWLGQKLPQKWLNGWLRATPKRLAFHAGAAFLIIVVSLILAN